MGHHDDRGRYGQSDRDRERCSAVPGVLPATGGSVAQTWVPSGGSSSQFATGGSTSVARANSDGTAGNGGAGIVSSGVAGNAGASGSDTDFGTAGRSASDVADPTEAGRAGAASGEAPGESQRIDVEPNLLVAFLGDQGDNVNSDTVLELVRSEGAVAVVHNGDYDYANSPTTWNGRIDRILGPNYPYFAVAGNHDAPAWNGPDGYASFIAARLARVPQMHCLGDPGVKANCYFRGLLMVQSCVGTSELAEHGDCGADSAEQVDFIRTSLATRQTAWAICSWHKNQHDMQVGTKSDEVGWQAYEACLKGGAIINTAHEHSYSRTFNLTDFGNRESGFGRTGPADALEVRDGQSFVFVSGLGGHSIRDFDGSHDADTWWASYATATRWQKNGQSQRGTGTYGALFIRFHVMGDPRRAWGYFKDVSGRVIDEFTISLQTPTK